MKKNIASYLRAHIKALSGNSDGAAINKVVLALLAAAVFLSVVSLTTVKVWAACSENFASEEIILPFVCSDLADYQPGTTATLFGFGFQPGEVVELVVQHADGTPTEETDEDHLPWQAVVDESGNFVTTWHVCEDDCLNSVLRATAFGLSSGITADTVFADAISGTVSLLSACGSYSQNFDSLASSGASSTTPAGWGFEETPSEATYTAGTGSGTTGDTYSFGAAASTERALGALQSGSKVSILGGLFVNNTGSTITGLKIQYVGEQWRLGALGRIDQLLFELNQNATTLTAAGFVGVPALNFTAPQTGPTVGALDGNASANRTLISSTITGLSIPNAQTFSVRWTDLNATGSDDGLAIDDFVIIPLVGTITAQPANITACVGGSASFTVGTTGASQFNWRKRGSGWGSGGWTINTGGGGRFVGSSTGNNSGDASSNGGNDINTGGKAWGLFNSGGGTTEALRPFGSAMAIGETFSIDMDNGNITGTVGLGLQNIANNNNRLEVFFVGGNPSYTVSDNAGSTLSGVGFTRSGINVRFTLTGVNSYSVTITRYSSTLRTAQTYTQSGTLKGTAGTTIDRLRLFNSNAGSGGAADLFFNNISVDCKDDNANNSPYTPSWDTGDDGGQKPLSNGGNISGATTATLTINPVAAGDAGTYDVCVSDCQETLSASATLTVQADTTPPIVTCPAATTVSADGNCQATIPNVLPGVIASDDCGAVTLSQSPTAGTTVSTGNHTITVTATDGSANSAQCTTSLTVQDTTAPTIICPTCPAITPDANCQATVPNLVNIADSVNDFSGTQGQGSWYYGSETAFNSASFVQLPFFSSGTWNGTGCFGTPFLDTQSGHPGVGGCDGFSAFRWAVRRYVAECAGTFLVKGTFSDDLANNCGDGVKIRIRKNNTDLSFTVIGSGVVPDFQVNPFDGQRDYFLTVTLAVGDTLDFAIDPLFDVGCDQTRFNANIRPLVTDNCCVTAPPGAPGITQSPAAGSVITGTTIVTLTTTDCAGNQGTCQTTLTINDTTPPVITCPANVTVQCFSAVPASDFAGGSATDNCGTPTVTFISDSATAGSSSCNNVITRTYKATDASGNMATCTQTITVNDTTAPSVSCATAPTLTNPSFESGGGAGTQTITGWSNFGSGTYQENFQPRTGSFHTKVYGQFNIVQNFSGWYQDLPASPGQHWRGSVWALNPSSDYIRGGNSAFLKLEFHGPSGFISAVESDERLDFDTRTDVYIELCADGTAPAGATFVRLVGGMFEQEGDASGSVYFDDADLSMLKVSADASCQGTVPDLTGLGSGTDNCGGGVSITQSPVAGSLLGLGSHTITLTGTDSCGNTASCNQTLDVVDCTAPDLTCAAPHLDNNSFEKGNGPPGFPNNGLTIDDWGTFGAPGGNVFHEKVSAHTGQFHLKIFSQFTGALNFSGAYQDLPAAAGEVWHGSAYIMTSSGDAISGANKARVQIEFLDGSFANLATIGSASLTSADPTDTYQLYSVVATAPAGTAYARLVMLYEGDAANSGGSAFYDSASLTRIVLSAGAGCLATVPDLVTGSSASDNCDTSVAISQSPAAGSSIGVGVTTVSVLATDDSGNVSECRIDICVIENTPPVITCPANVTVQCYSAVPAADFSGGSATDNCGTPTVAHQGDSESNPGSSCNNTITRTYRATDAAGNTADCTQTITVNDTTAPGITCPADVTIDCNDSTDPSQTGSASATDNCGSASVAYSDAVAYLGCPVNYTITRTWTATDGCGNTASCVQLVDVRDTTAPTINGVGANATINCPATPSFSSPTASDDCNPSPSLTFVDATTPGSCAGNYSVTRTWTATDACGNSSTASQTITSQDVTAPTLSGQGANATIACPATPSFTAPTASDACDASPAISSSDVTTPGSCAGNYSVTRTWTATDACGNASASVSQTITVQDVTAPAITCPANVTIECNTSTAPAATGGSATATDACDASPVITSSDSTAAGSCPQAYVISRTWTATDACGNSAQCVQTINVVDSTAPVVTAPANTTVECTASTDPSATGSATATDNCDTFAPPAPTPTAWINEFHYDNTGTDAGEFVEIAGTAGITFGTNCNITLYNGSGGAVYSTISLNGMTIPDEGCGFGTLSFATPGIQNGAPDGIALALCVGGTVSEFISYEGTFTAVGGSAGGMTSTDVGVTETGTEPVGTSSLHKIGTGNSGAAFTWAKTTTSASPGTLNVGQTISPCFTGGSGGIVIGHSDTEVAGCGNTKTITRTWTATDSCGNTGSAVQTITTVDTTPPSITCPANTSVQCNTDSSSAATGVATGSDTCGTVTISSSDSTAAGSCPQNSTITRTWTATDACGNTAQCVQTINVVDTTAPVLSVPANTTVECPGDTSVAANGTATATDNCDTLYVAPPTPTAWINEFHYDNSGADVGEFVEIAGTAGTTFTASCSITLYNGAGGASYSTISLNGMTIPDEGCGYGTLSFATPGIQNGSPDGIALALCLGGTVKEFISYEGTFTAVGGAAAGLTSTDVGVSETGSDPAGLSLQKTGSGNTGAAFAWTGPSAQSPGSLNVGQTISPCYVAGGGLVVTHTDSEVAGCGNTKTVTRAWTATDACGNVSSANQTITVVDTTAPSITCPANATVECNTDSSSAATGSATGSDACGSVTITQSDSTAAGSCPQASVITRTWTATDACGNTAQCVQTINVVDTTAPVLSVPANTTVECTGDTSVSANGTATATDNCDTPPAVAPTPTAWINEFHYDNTGGDVGEFVEVAGTAGITFSSGCSITLYNGSGGASYGTFSLAGMTIPDAGCGYGTISVATPGLQNGAPDGIALALCLGGTVKEFISYEGSFVAVGGPAAGMTSTDVGVSQTGSEPIGSSIHKIGSGNTGAAFTWATTTSGTPGSLNVGQTISPCGSGGGGLVVTHSDSSADGCGNTEVITRTWTATDSCGNSSSANQTITTVDTTAPSITVPASTTVQCTGDTSVGANGSATGSDTCGSVTVASSDVSVGGCGNTEVITRTWTVTDACGNTASGDQTITTVDTTAPSISVPASTTVECTGDTSVGGNGSATGSDTCGSVTIASSDVSVGGCGDTEVITRTWTVTDECGNSSSGNQTITTVDTTAPSITVPASTTVECTGDTSVGANGSATGSDTCGSVTIASSDVSVGGCGNTEVITRTWTVTDECGNSTSGDQTITTVDTTAPSITVPASTTVECTGDTSVGGNGSATGSDTCGSVTVSSSDVSVGGCGNTEVITRTWTVTDACGNTASGNQTITTVDTTAPSITVPASTTVECTGDTSPASNGSATGSDTCGSVTITSSDVSVGGCGNTEVITRTWTVTDACGNTASGDQTITTVDTTAPSITVPASTTVECTGDTSVGGNGSATGSDTCGSVTVSSSDVSVGGCGDTEVITRTWTVTDECGNSTSGDQTITTVDTTAPSITVPASTTVECTGDTSVGANGSATGSDTCGSVTISSSDSSVAGCGNTEVITRTWTVTDECGNSTSGDQTITTVDTTAPSLSGVPANSTVECDSVPAAAVVTASDTCGSAAVVLGESSLGTCPTILTRTWTATDACGNSASASQAITVQDTTAPVLSGVPANITIECDQPVPAAATVTASDNCDSSVPVTLGQSSAGACPTVITRTWSASDDCGNSVSASQTITIQDTTDPVITCPANVSVECTSTSSLPANTGTATATDNCDSNVAITYSDSSAGGCPAVITRTWTATDDCGNSSSCEQTITSDDTVKPVLTGCPEDIVIRPCDALPAPATVTALDACQGAITVTYTQTTVTNVNFDGGSSDDDDSSGDSNSSSDDSSNGCGGNPVNNVLILRTWTATDACGNSVQCSQTITINHLANCVFSQGYWKNHAADWPVTSLTIGCTTYNQTQLLAILNTPPQGKATYILAHQLIAALLNQSLGACTSASVQSCINQAQTLLCTWALNSSPPSSVRNQMTSLACCLDNFNNGYSGNRHCSSSVFNHPPVAMDDMDTTSENTPVIISILANDVDSDGDSLGVITATDPASGTITINANGTITYTPNTGFSGSDSFTYIIADGEGGFSSAVVCVFVQAGVPPPPSGQCTDEIQSCLARSTVHFTSSSSAGTSRYVTFEGALTHTEGNMASDFRDNNTTAQGTLKVTVAGNVVYDSLAVPYAVINGDPIDNDEKWQFSAGSQEKATILWNNSQAYNANRDPALPMNLGKLFTKFIHANETEFRFEWKSTTRKPLIVVVDGIVILTRSASGVVSSTLPNSKTSSRIDIVFPGQLVPGNVIEWYNDANAGDGLQNLIYMHDATSDGNSSDTYFNAGGQFWITVPVAGVGINNANKTAQVEMTIGEYQETLIGCTDFEAAPYLKQCNAWNFRDDCDDCDD